MYNDAASSCSSDLEIDEQTVGGPNPGCHLTQLRQQPAVQQTPLKPLNLRFPVRPRKQTHRTTLNVLKILITIKNNVWDIEPVLDSKKKVQVNGEMWTCEWLLQRNIYLKLVVKFQKAFERLWSLLKGRLFNPSGLWIFVQKFHADLFNICQAIPVRVMVGWQANQLRMRKQLRMCPACSGRGVYQAGCHYLQ